MDNVFTDYPAVSWKQNWTLSADGNPPQFQTVPQPGTVQILGSACSLRLIDPSIPCTTRLLYNGLSLHCRKSKARKRIDLVCPQPGVISGLISDLPDPILQTTAPIASKNGLSVYRENGQRTLLLCDQNRFILLHTDQPEETAITMAEEFLEVDFADLAKQETATHNTASKLLSINARHNPPVILGAESLRQRLRNRNAALPGTWSVAEGFEQETFSLNEIYPLTNAWCILDPTKAMELVGTALGLQRANGGFLAWTRANGASSSAAPWPLLIQSFELAWQHSENESILHKHLPSLRKYLQWAFRYFDPHRDGIPAWQSEQEAFVPGTYERDKATPDLTVLLLAETDALLRLCEEAGQTEESAASIIEQRNQLIDTLKTIFWNPEEKAFSNVWKNGHYIHQPSFASFMPLFWEPLESNYKESLLENFEETHGFPGSQKPDSWKHEQIDDTKHLPAIHQFMAFQALRHANAPIALQKLFINRAREGFAEWFERESIEAARLISHRATTDEPAYALGTINASLILVVQSRFQVDVSSHAPALKTIRRWQQRLQFNMHDVRIILFFLLAILATNLIYNLPRNQAAQSAQIAEAVLNYKEGNFSRTIQICRAFPDEPVCNFLQANLMLLAERFEDAPELYRKALLVETESPSALLGYALSLQLNRQFEQAQKRYNDFLDIYEMKLTENGQSEFVDRTYELLRFAEEKFSKPPRWRQLLLDPFMHDLGL